MAATITFPDIIPDRKSTSKRTPRILRADFGDGYNQTAPDGINAFKEEWDLAFMNYPNTMIDELVTFHDTMGGTIPFLWTPPGETVEKQWKTTGGYKRSYTGFQSGGLTFTIERVFNP